MLPGLVLLLAAGVSSPCATATSSCTEWITLPKQEQRLLVFRNYPLGVKNSTVTRALVFVHGINRDGDNHFRTALAAAFLAGKLEDTIIIAPRFASRSGVSGNQAGDCRDTLAENEANWICDPQRPDHWRSGGGEAVDEKVTSFDFMDEIVRRVARKEIFPNLKKIIVAGHSAGGQFVIRYEMTNRVHDLVDVPISYVVGNPSAYPYVDSHRPTLSALPSTISAAAPGFAPPSPSKVPSPFVSFPDAGNCSGYDVWPYGLRNRVGYADRLSESQLRTQLIQRPVTYLLGEADILPLGVFDSSCPAMAQGPTRLARGLSFGRYVNEKLGAHHETIVVPFCGHSARCLFTADVALPLILPD
jgi:pimeloyl-ACP methyl ester carboxylesterase